MAKFKVVLIYFGLYHSNLQDEIAGQDGVRKLMFCEFEDFQDIIDNEDFKQKYLWGIVKQVQHGLFREVVKIPGSRWEVVSRIQHLGPVIFTTSINTMLYLYTIRVCRVSWIRGYHVHF